MLKVRLQRFGKKHAPQFRVVLTDSKNSTVSGRFKEVLGTLNPKTGTPELKGDRVLYWVSKGAQLTPTVHNLMVKIGSLRGAKIPKGQIPAPEAPAAPAEVPAGAPVETPAAPAEGAEEASTDSPEMPAETPAAPEEGATE